MKGATLGKVQIAYVLLISIHAPVKGATSRLCLCRLRRRYFNPRSREGSDHLRRQLGPHPHYFNPRSREGSDLDRWIESVSL